MLKAAVAAALMVFLAAGQSQADTLLTGSIRDTSGAPIRAARVTALDAAGRPLGVDIALADGTFAVDAAAPPVTVLITCNYCRPLRVRVRGGEPVVAFVERFSALTARGPAPADLRALPYRSAADLASLVPFTVTNGDRIADRALDHTGAVTINGVPFYDPADGSSAGQLLPAHAIATLQALTPLAAPAYGGYASAGVDDFGLRDRAFSAGRLDLGGAADASASVAGPAAGAGYAVSSDAGDERQALNAAATVPLAGGRLSIDALDLADAFEHASGAGLTFATDSRRFATDGSLSATQIANSSLITIAARVRNRGPLALEFGVRALRATAALDGAEAVQSDAAVYAAARRQAGVNDVSATIGFDRGSDAGLAGGSQDGALVGALADDIALAPEWSVHFGTVSNLRIPTFTELSIGAPSDSAGDRSVLFEQSLTYTDLNRLRVTAATYTQRTSGPAAATTNGIGLDAAWQLGPYISVRAWLLNTRQVFPPSPSALPYGIGPGVASVGPGLLWLTYQKWIRVDALVRAGALEGDLRIPFDATRAFTIGTARYDGRRYTTLGFTLR